MPERRARAATDDVGPPPDADAAEPVAKAREKEARASTTDAEARAMKVADGGFRPAYDVQFAAAIRSGAVAGVAAGDAGPDMGKLAPMSDALAGCYGARPGQHLADGGSAKLADIAAFAPAGVMTYVPVPAPLLPHPGSGGADVVRAPELRHAVGGVDADVHLGGPAPVGARAQPVPDTRL